MPSPVADSGTAQVEQAPGPTDVATDGRIQEAPVQGNARELQHGWFRVAPRALRDLHELERKADDVAGADDGDIPSALPAASPEQQREQHAMADEQVVAGHR